MIESLNKLVAQARRSEFYRHYYREVPATVTDLRQLPILEQAAYWKAYREAPERVLCHEHIDGHILSSGGTTGAPKRTHVTRSEWTNIAVAGADALLSAGLSAGDRVGNLCAAGDLSTSMLFIHGSLLAAPVPLLELPLSYAMEPAAIASKVMELNIEALVGTPSILIPTLEVYATLRQDAGDDSRAPLRKALFLGEMLSEEQARHMRHCAPGLHIASAGHSMVDVGLVGTSDVSCTLGEHRETSSCIQLEIVDPETREVIEEAGRPGELVVTSFVRRLQPIIRYQVGDMAEWTEPPGERRKYRLAGRAPNFWSLGNGSYSYDDVKTVVDRLGVRYVALQLHLSTVNDLEQLEVRLVPSHDEEPTSDLSKKIVEELTDNLKWFRGNIEAGFIGPLTVRWCSPADLSLSARVGKTLPVVDDR